MVNSIAARPLHPPPSQIASRPGARRNCGRQWSTFDVDGPCGRQEGL